MKNEITPELLERLGKIYIGNDLIDGNELELLNMLKKEGISEKTLSILANKEQEELLEKSNLELKGPKGFNDGMRGIYNGKNLGDSKPMLNEGINGKPLDRGYGKILVYKLSYELSTLISEYSNKLKLLFQKYKEKNPNSKLDFVGYGEENLHISIISSNFSKDEYEKEEASGFKEKFNGKKFNNLNITCDSIGLGTDSIVIKFIPVKPLIHVCNQIKGFFLSKDKGNNDFELTKQGWGLNCTIGRFVGECDDKNFISELRNITTELESKLKNLGKSTLMNIEPKILSHYFSENGNSEFILK